MTPTTDRSRWAALYVLCAGTLMIVLDATIVNVALPSIQDDLDFSPSNLAWVANAYLLAGGVLTDAISWHWIFLINLPIGVLTAVLALRLVPSRPGLGLSEGTDLLGALLLTVGVMLGVYAILDHSWALGAVGVALVAAFVLRQARVANPLMPLRLFRSRDVVGTNVIMALLVVGMFGSFFL